jgi:hypothetical protein
VDKDSSQLANLIMGSRHDIQSYGDKILDILEKIMASLDDLVAKVKSEGDVIDSAVVLIQGFKDKLDAAIAAGADPARLQELSDAMDAQTTKLAAAVAASTPASTPAAEATASAPSDSPAPTPPVDVPPADGSSQ